jgi:hypothetical protein
VIASLYPRVQGPNNYRLNLTARDPPFGVAGGFSPIISQGTPIRSICAVMSSGSDDESVFLRGILNDRTHLNPYVD